MGPRDLKKGMARGRTDRGAENALFRSRVAVAILNAARDREGTAAAMPAIFISHASVDKPLAAEIRATLTRLGFEHSFLDYDIALAEDWERRLYEELSRCHAVLLVLTPAWFASKWCFAELVQSRALGKLILPVRCAPLERNAVLPEVQSIDLTDWNADGLRRLEERLRAISDELARGFTLDPNRPPYPGIHAFEEADAAIYFGRDEESRAVLERLDARRTHGGAHFVVIIGASGSGKSSLLKASVLPLLKRRRAQWVVLPDIRPEKAPMEALAKALAEFSGKPETWREWHDTAERRRRRIGDRAFRAGRTHRRGKVRDRAVADRPVRGDVHHHTCGRARRIPRIAAGMFARDAPFMVIATGRSDVLEGLIESSELVGHYETFPLTAMPLERYPRLIEGPAAVAGINVEKGLSDRIGRDVESREALPLLAHMLALLYQRGGEDKKLSLAEYELLGDPARGLNPIQNSISLAAEEATARVKPNEREFAALRDAFVPHLVRVRLDDGKRVRQTARRSELPQDALRLIGALTDARLLTTRSDGEQRAPLVEVTHESLFKSWPTLDSWLTEEQAFLTDLERIREAHENWTKTPDDQKGGELLYGLLLSRARDWLLKYPQRFVSREMEPVRAFIAESAKAADATHARQRQIRYAAFATLGIAVLGFAAFGFYSRQLYLNAETATQEATRQRSVAEGERASAEAARDNAELAERRAQEKANEAEEERQRAEQATENAVVQRDQAEAQRRQAQITQSQFLTDLARQHYERQDYGTALALALEALPVQRRSGIRPYVPGAESLLYQSVTALRELPSPDTRSLSSGFLSPDGTRLVTISSKGVAQLWNTKEMDRDPVPLIGHDGVVNAAAFSPDGRRVVTGGEDETARLWDAESGKPVAELRGHTGRVAKAVFSPDGKLVATASADGTARLWDGHTGAPVRPLNGHQQKREIWSVVFSPNGEHVLTASDDGTARIWNAANGDEIAVLEHKKSVSSALYSRDGSLIVTASADEMAGLWRGVNGQNIKFFGAGSEVNYAAFAPDGQTIVTASGDWAARIWDLTNLSEPARTLQHEDRVYDAAISPDGALILTTAEGGIARLWDAETGKPAGQLLPQGNYVWTGTFSSDGRQIVTASDTVRLWRTVPELHARILHPGVALKSVQFVSGGTQILALGHDDTLTLIDLPNGTIVPNRSIKGVRSISVTRDGSRFVTALRDNTAQVRETTTGRVLLSIGSKDMPVLTPVISADGRWVVGTSQTARVWDAENGREILALPPQRASIVAIAVSPDRTRIATALRNRAIHVFDAAGTRISDFLRHTADIQSLAFSPDSEKVVSTSADQTAQIWTAATGELIHALPTTNSNVFSAVFSPDGTTVLTASNDETARIWDVTLGVEVGLLRRHPNPIDFRHAAYAPDGRSIVTASDDGARIWPAFPQTNELMEYARKIMPRRLTPEQRTQFYLTRPDSEPPRSPREP